MIDYTKLKIKDRYSYEDYYKDEKFFIYNPKTKHISRKFHCRQMFGWHFNKNIEYIGYKDCRYNIQKLNEFWELIENRLRLKQKTIFYPINKSKVILKLSPFWTKTSLCRSLCTLFLRAGIRYYNGNFVEALKKYQNSRKIIPVIEYFLKGNIKFAREKMNKGVVDTFLVGGSWSNNYKYHLREDYKELLVKL